MAARRDKRARRARREEQALPSYAGRRYTVLTLFAIAACAVMWRAVDRQIMEKDFLQSEGADRYLARVEVPAHRGLITDRRGDVLALSTPVDSIAANPRVLGAEAQRIMVLAKALELNPERLRKRLLRYSQRHFVYLVVIDGQLLGRAAEHSGESDGVGLARVDGHQGRGEEVWAGAIPSHDGAGEGEEDVPCWEFLSEEGEVRGRLLGTPEGCHDVGVESNGRARLLLAGERGTDRLVRRQRLVGAVLVQSGCVRSQQRGVSGATGAARRCRRGEPRRGVDGQECVPRHSRR